MVSVIVQNIRTTKLKGNYPLIRKIGLSVDKKDPKGASQIESSISFDQTVPRQYVLGQHCFLGPDLGLGQLL